MHVDIKVALIAGFAAIFGASVPIISRQLFPPVPYAALISTELKMGQSAVIDNGIYKIQARKIEGEPHRFYALIVGGTKREPFRHDFPELAQAQRVNFGDKRKEYALHVLELKSGTNNSAKSVVIEVHRLE